MSRLDAALSVTARRARDRAADFSAIVQRLIDECHPDQREFALDESRYIAGLIGRGGGKTTAGQVRFVRKLLLQRNRRCLFVAKTRKHAKELIWSELKQLFRNLGIFEELKWNETELTLTVTRTGSSLRLVGADKQADLEALRGVTFHEVVVDEAASHPDELLRYLIREVIGPRLVGTLCLIGTAGRRLAGLFYEVSRRGSTLSVSNKGRPDGWKGWILYRWSLRSAVEATADNPIPKLVELLAAQEDELAAQGLSPDNPARRREYDAEWAADDTVNVYQYRPHDDAGLPWNQWDPPRDGPLQIARLPAQWSTWIHVLAMDPGWSASDPRAFNVFSVSPDDPGRVVYHRLSIERSSMYAQLAAKLVIGDDLKHETPGGIIGAIGEWPNALVADASGALAGAELAELANVYGLTFDPADKSTAYKVGAIELVNGEFFEGRIKVLKGSPLEAQLLDLQWDETRAGTRCERKGQPNHSADCLIYARAKLSEFLTALRDDPPPAALSPHDPAYQPPLPAEPDPNAHLLGDPDYGALGL